MKIYEYQAKELLSRYHIPVPNGIMVDSAIDAGTVTTTIGEQVVIKAQIYSGGRAKGGGIRFAKSSKEAVRVADDMLGTTLVTKQTGPKGQRVERVLVEEAIEIEKEFYLCMVVDRNSANVVIFASNDGGVDVEETAEKLIKISIDPRVGLQTFQARQIALAFQLKESNCKHCIQIVQALYDFFMDYDVAIIEINPLILTKENCLLVIDAKISFDDNALFRHPELIELKGTNQEMLNEIEAAKHQVSYVKLNGNIGCLVNGAGLALATMDIIKLHGSMPSNFLDIGGDASIERVENALKILLADPDVKSILVNIFGGIVRCDHVAIGMIEAAKRVKIHVPIVIRLAGVHCEIAEELLAKSSTNFIVAKCLRDAAMKAIATSRGDQVFVDRPKPACP